MIKFLVRIVIIIICANYSFAQTRPRGFVTDDPYNIVFTNHKEIGKTVIDKTKIEARYKFTFKQSRKTEKASSAIIYLLIGDKFAKSYDINKFYYNGFRNKLNREINKDGYLINSNPYFSEVYFNRSKQNYDIYTGAILGYDIMFIYKELINKHNIKLLDGEKEILGYECKKASINYAGILWTVWYAPKINNNLGPWKLGGLPGMILEATDRNSDFHFQCFKLLDNDFYESDIIRYKYELENNTNKETVLKHLTDCFDRPFKMAKQDNENYFVKVISRNPKNKMISLDDRWTLPYFPLERY